MTKILQNKMLFFININVSISIILTSVTNMKVHILPVGCNQFIENKKQINNRKLNRLSLSIQFIYCVDTDN